MKTAYSKYKSTGVPWLPTVPDEWDMVKTKYLFKERVQKGFAEEPLLAATQSQGVIPKSMYDVTTVTAQKDFHLLKLVTVGDFVISLRSFQGGIEYAYYRGIISPAYTVFFSKNIEEVNPQFFRYFFKSQPFVKSLTLFVTGIREGQNIDYNEFKNSFLPLPSIQEQNAIANYLDTRIEKINLFISNKQKLIDLLKTKKKSFLDTLVRKGIPSKNKKFNDSGISWLGDIPENWQQRTIGSITTVVSKKNHAEKELLSVVRDLGVIKRSEGVDNHNFIPDDLSNYKLVKPGQLVLNKMKTWQGSLAISELEGIVSPAYIVCTVVSDMFPKYLHHLLRCYTLIYYYNKISYGIRIDQWDMHYQDFKKTPILIPPYEEQKEIVKQIEKEFERIDSTIIRIEKEIEVIKEYKQSLIAEVVTGQRKIIE